MDIVKVLKSIRPGAEWTLNGESYDGLTWLDKTKLKPTLAEIEAAWPAVSNELQIKRQRILDDVTEEASVKAEAQVQAFLNMTPAQLDAWIDTNITGAGNKTAFKILGRIVLAAGRGRRLR